MHDILIIGLIMAVCVLILIKISRKPKGGSSCGSGGCGGSCHQCPCSKDKDSQ